MKTVARRKTAGKAAEEASTDRSGMISDARDAEGAVRAARGMMSSVSCDLAVRSATWQASVKFERQAEALEEDARSIMKMLRTGKAGDRTDNPWAARLEDLERSTTKDFANWWLNKILCDLLDPGETRLIEELHQYPAKSTGEARGIARRVNAVQSKLMRLKADGRLLQAYRPDQARK